MRRFIHIAFGAAAVVTSFVSFAASGKIAVEHFCDVSDRSLMAQFVTDATYARTEEAVKRGHKRTERYRTLWDIKCELDSGSCRALTVKLDSIEAGKPLTFFDTSLPEGMRIAARTGKVVTIVWGPYRTFVVDLNAGRIEFKESGPTEEGRGGASCSGTF